MSQRTFTRFLFTILRNSAVDFFSLQMLVPGIIETRQRGGRLLRVGSTTTPLRSSTRGPCREEVVASMLGRSANCKTEEKHEQKRQHNPTKFNTQSCYFRVSMSPAKISHTTLRQRSWAIRPLCLLVCFICICLVSGGSNSPRYLQQPTADRKSPKAECKQCPNCMHSQLAKFNSIRG